MPSRQKSPEIVPKSGRIVPDIVPGVRRKRLHKVTESEALALGFTPDRCAEVFRKAAGDVKWEYMRWVNAEYVDKDGEFHNEDLWEDYCFDCAVKEVAKETERLKGLGYAGVMVTVDGWDDYPERDTVCLCYGCSVLLAVSLSEYGIHDELYEAHYAPLVGTDAWILAEVAGGIGDLQEEHHGRLALLGLATWWQQEHGDWEANPLVSLVWDGAGRGCDGKNQ